MAGLRGYVQSIHTHTDRHTDRQREREREREREVRTVQVERVCPLCRDRAEGFVISIIDHHLGGSMRVAQND